MKLQEWIENKAQELREAKYREVTFKRASPAQMAKNTISFMLFDNTQIPLDATVAEIDKGTLPDTYNTSEYLEVVRVTMEVLKPRKRKMEREDFYVQLVS